MTKKKHKGTTAVDPVRPKLPIRRYLLTENLTDYTEGAVHAEEARWKDALRSQQASLDELAPTGSVEGEGWDRIKYHKCCFCLEPSINRHFLPSVGWLRERSNHRSPWSQCQPKLASHDGMCSSILSCGAEDNGSRNLAVRGCVEIQKTLRNIRRPLRSTRACHAIPSRDSRQDQRKETRRHVRIHDMRYLGGGRI